MKKVTVSIDQLKEWRSLWSTYELDQKKSIKEFCAEMEIPYSEIRDAYFEENWDLDRNVSIAEYKKDLASVTPDTNPVINTGNIAESTYSVLASQITNAKALEDLVQAKLISALSNSEEEITVNTLVTLKRLIANSQNDALLKLIDIMKMLKDMGDAEQSKNSMLAEIANKLIGNPERAVTVVDDIRGTESTSGTTREQRLKLFDKLAPINNDD